MLQSGKSSKLAGTENSNFLFSLEVEINLNDELFLSIKENNSQ